MSSTSICFLGYFADYLLFHSSLCSSYAHVLQNYEFQIVNDGIDKRSSMLRSKPGHRRQSLSTAGVMKTEQRTRRRSSLLQAMAGCDVGDVQQHQEQADSSLQAHPIARQPGEEKLSSRNASMADQGTDDDEVETLQKEDEVAKLASSMSALKLIPPSVRFGRGRGRRGFSSS